jgi:hypothetical protein
MLGDIQERLGGADGGERTRRVLRAAQRHLREPDEIRHGGDLDRPATGDLSRAAAQGNKLLERQLAALASSTGFHGRLFPAARAAGVSAGTAVRQLLRLPSGRSGQL